MVVVARTALAADGLDITFGHGPHLQLAPRETGAPPNEQPAALSPEALGRLLAKVRMQADVGDEALFAPAEIEQMQGRIAQLLARATDEQDLLLDSAYRRGIAGPLSPRNAAGAAHLVAPPGTQQPRPDWVSLSVADAVASRTAETVPASPANADERLTTLKRLHDKGLITEDEYQQKRREILQAL